MHPGEMRTRWRGRDPMYDNMNARHRLDNVHAIMNLPSIRLVCPRAPRRARGKEGGGGLRRTGARRANAQGGTPGEWRCHPILCGLCARVCRTAQYVLAPLRCVRCSAHARARIRKSNVYLLLSPKRGEGDRAKKRMKRRGAAPETHGHNRTCVEYELNDGRHKARRILLINVPPQVPLLVPPSPSPLRLRRQPPR